MKNGFEPMRILTSDHVKGERRYLDTQKKYELLRTVIFFAISLSLYTAGYVTTKTRLNLLTVVAVLGCLPACKSLVGMIMFFRFKSCSETAADAIDDAKGGLAGLYDMVFTSYNVNFVVDHLVFAGGSLNGYSEKPDFPEKEFQKHIGDILKAENFKNINVKIFTDLNKYTERLHQLQNLENGDVEIPLQILEVLKSVAL